MHEIRTPKVGDKIAIPKHAAVFIVKNVDEVKKTVDADLTTKIGWIEKTSPGRYSPFSTWKTKKQFESELSKYSSSRTTPFRTQISQEQEERVQRMAEPSSC